MASEDPGFLSWLGINLPDLVAGFCGGVVNAFIFKRSDPLSILGSMVVGALTANYLSGPIGHYVGTQSGASAFIVGLAGMAICQGIVESAKSWKPFQARAGSDDKPNA
jgi:membrane-associated protease RseP (regulator of RpoE activity)